jgi:hypothetical protein
MVFEKKKLVKKSAIFILRYFRREKKHRKCLQIAAGKRYTYIIKPRNYVKNATSSIFHHFLSEKAKLISKVEKGEMPQHHVRRNAPLKCLNITRRDMPQH